MGIASARGNGASVGAAAAGKAGPRSRPARRSRSAAALAVVLAGLGLQGGAARAEGIQESMHWALRSSFDVKADDERQAAAEARLMSSYEAFLPTAGYVINRRIDSKLTYSPEFITDPTVPGGSDFLQRRQPNEDGFLLTMPLFDGFKRYNELQAARSSAAAGLGLRDAKAQQILFDTASAYLAVLRDRAIIRLREAAIADVRKVAHSVAMKREVFDATNAELALADSRVIDAVTNLEQARAALIASEAELIRLAGIDANPTALPLVPHNLLPASLDELQAILLNANPTLRAARLDAESADHLARASYAQFLPQVNLTFAHGRRGPVSLTPFRVRETSTMVQAIIPIYQPGEFGNVALASASARQKHYESLDLERTLVAKATVAFKQRRSFLTQVAQADQRVRRISRAVEARNMELRIGSMTTVDVLNTVAELAEARIAKINLEFARDQATYSLAAVMNRLRA